MFDSCADALQGLAVDPGHAGEANVFSSLCGICGDGSDMEISPTEAFQQLSLEHRLPQSAVADPKAPVPPVRCLRGIHVQRPWARMLLEGVKTIEVRSYPLNSYLNEDLWLIENAGSRRKGDLFKTQIIGGIRFGSHVRYNTDKQFEADVRAHRQEPRKWLEMAWKKTSNVCLRVARGLSPDATGTTRSSRHQRRHWLQGGLSCGSLSDNVAFASSATPPCFYGGVGRLLPPRAGFDANEGDCARYRARPR